MAMVVFLELNDAALAVDDDDAVETMLSVAAGGIDEATLATWVAERIRTIDTTGA